MSLLQLLIDPHHDLIHQLDSPNFVRMWQNFLNTVYLPCLLDTFSYPIHLLDPLPYLTLLLDPFSYLIHLLDPLYNLPKISSHTKPIMDKLQFAYLPNRSTDDATTTLIHKLSQHLDRKSKSKYARCLFIDYSSAFNTMQPHTLINRLAEYNIPARLQLFVLDFLTDRKQYVRTETELSSTTSINTGAPQGCVLSAFLFIIYTNALSLCSTTCKIIKYADDTVVIGLINNDKELKSKSTETPYPMFHHGVMKIIWI